MWTKPHLPGKPPDEQTQLTRDRPYSAVVRAHHYGGVLKPATSTPGAGSPPGRRCRSVYAERDSRSHQRDRHPANLDHFAEFHDPGHHQLACPGHQEPSPSPGAHESGQAHHPDDCQQRASADPPADPPSPCVPRQPRGTVPAGWYASRAPHHQVLPMQSRPRPPRRAVRSRHGTPVRSARVRGSAPRRLAAEPWRRRPAVRSSIRRAV